MEKEIDLLSVVRLLMKHIVVIVLVTFLSGIAALIISTQFISKQYTSKAQLYVENKSDDKQSGVNVNDINAAQKLATTCVIIFKSNTVMNELAKDSEIPYSPGALGSMISVAAVNNTEVMEIKVTCGDPSQAHYIADKMLSICMKRYKEIIQSGSISIVDEATFSNQPTSPNVMVNTFIGLMAGFVVSCLLLLVRDILDKRVKPADDLAEMYSIPLFAEIMDFEAKGTKTSGYSYKEATK